MQREDYIPDAVIGDLDSARPEVLEYYKSKGSQVVHVESQDNTDLDKVLAFVAEKDDIAPTRKIVIYGAFGGRVDQMFSAIGTLTRLQPTTEVEVILMDSWSTMVLLLPGKHAIFPSQTLESKISCGFYPICSANSMVATQGLKWNVGDISQTPPVLQEISYQGLISTSNEITGDHVVIETSQPLLWSTTVNNLP